MFSSFKGKRKEGFALIATIIIVAVALFAIAAGLFAVQRSNVSAVVSQAKSMQAYYLARSGIVAVAEWIKAHPDKASELIDKTSSPVHLKNGSVGTVEVSVEATDNGLIIVSTGYVVTHTTPPSTAVETLRLFLTKQEGFTFNKAIIVDTLSLSNGVAIPGDVEVRRGALNLPNSTLISGNLEVNGNLTMSNTARIDGSVEASGDVSMSNTAEINGSLEANGNLTMSNNSEIDGDVKVTGSIELNNSAKITGKQIEHSTPVSLLLSTSPDPVPPSELEKMGYLSLWNKNKTINASGEYSGMSIGKGTLTFDTSNGDITIVVDGDVDLNNGAEFVIEGNHKVIFFAKSFSVSTKASVNADGKTKNFLLCSSQEGNITFSNNSTFNGYIYAPRSIVSISNKFNFKGAIISRRADISNNVNFEPASMPVPLSDSASEINFVEGSWSY
jgi:type II secretory pathway pseudopilin PulG